jgi:hypothetical protein
MARVTYQSKDDAGHKFWTARHGRYVIRVDANRPPTERVSGRGRPAPPSAGRPGWPIGIRSS